MQTGMRCLKIWKTGGKYLGSGEATVYEDMGYRGKCREIRKVHGA